MLQTSNHSVCIDFGIWGAGISQRCASPLPGFKCALLNLAITSFFGAPVGRLVVGQKMMG
jgi:hypothetical protein